MQSGGQFTSDGLMTQQHPEFEVLYREHYRDVLSYCARRASRADAWDAAAEVFVVALRRFDDVPRGEGALPWLFGIARRVLANQRRSSERKRRLLRKTSTTERVTGYLPDEPVIRHEEQAEVLEALRALKPIDREIIQLTLWEELSPVEIADLLRISRGAVDKRYSRAKQRLARQLRYRTGVMKDATRIMPEKGGAA